MIIDHVGGDDSWLYTITGHDRFFISAAELFVFVSGLVMGIVYSSLIARSGIRAGIMKALKRAGLLYSLNVVLSIILSLLALALLVPWAPHWGSEGLAGFVGGIISLHRSYYLTDVLLLYTLLVTAAIPLLPLLARRRAWLTGLVLVASWGLWLSWQLWPHRIVLPWTIYDYEVFNFATWQVLFVTGMVLGFNRDAIGVRLRAIPAWGKYALMGVSGALFAVSVGFFVWSQGSPGTIDPLALARLFEKANVGVGRLVVFSIFVTFTFLLLTLAWQPMKKALGWLLLPLGQSALQAYGVHIFFVAAVAVAVPGLLGGVGNSPAANTAMQVLGIGLIWGLVQLSRPATARLRRAGKALAHRVGLAVGLSGTAGAGANGAGRVPRRGRLAVAAGLCTALLAVAVLGAIPFAGQVKQTLRALNHQGKNTVVYVPTVIPEATPLSVEASAASSGKAGAQAASTPAPLTSPMDTTGALLGMRVPNRSRDSAAGVSPALTPGATPQPTPVVYTETRTFNSQALGRTMSYIVFLPPAYKSHPDARYPVLYMLHGLGSTNTEFIRYGLFGWADELMRADMIKQFIIVLPEGEDSYFMDHADGGPRWGAYTAQDVVGDVDSHYRTIARRDSRAIGGVSMGGHAALQLSINYPEVFSIVGAHSPSLHSESTAPSFFGDEAYFEAHDPSHLFSANREIASTLKLWIDIGAGDAWLPLVSNFREQLQREGIAHEWHVFTGDEINGGHTAEYWSTHIPDYLRFYSSAFPG